MTAGLGRRAADWSRRLNYVMERLCALIMAVLVLDVWLGVAARYVLPWQLTFTEELARYLMIWVALLAVSCGIAGREHIGVAVLFDRLPPPLQRPLLLLDLIAFCFFAYLFYFGLGFAGSGASRFSMIFGMSKLLPFSAVPAAAALACIQIALVAARDHFAPVPAVAREV